MPVHIATPHPKQSAGSIEHTPASSTHGEAVKGTPDLPDLKYEEAYGDTGSVWWLISFALIFAVAIIADEYGDKITDLWTAISDWWHQRKEEK